MLFNITLVQFDEATVSFSWMEEVRFTGDGEPIFTGRQVTLPVEGAPWADIVGDLRAAASDALAEALDVRTLSAEEVEQSIKLEGFEDDDDDAGMGDPR